MNLQLHIVLDSRSSGVLELLYNQVLEKIQIAVRILSCNYDDNMINIWQKYDEIMMHKPEFCNLQW